MAFKFPFLSGDNDAIDKMQSSANALLSTALGLGPLGVAAYSNFKNIKSNNPDFLHKSRTNQMGDIHSMVGESFEKIQLDEKPSSRRKEKRSNCKI